MRYQEYAFILIVACLLSFTAQAQRYALPVFGTEQGLAGTQMNAIGQDHLGYLWLATENGVTRFDGKNAKNFTQHDGLGAKFCTSILCDSRNRIWVGHQGGGISVLSNDTILLYNEDNGLLNNQVNTLFEASDGRIWVGTFGGVSIFDGKEWSFITTDNGLVSNNVQAIAEDLEKNMWLGTYGAGVNVITPNAILAMHQGSGLVNNYVTSLVQRQDGVMLIGTLGGFSMYQNESFSQLTSADGLLNNQINAIALKSDAIWLASFNGLNRVSTAVTGLTEENGLPTNEILDVFCDAEGNVWAGSKKGLIKIRNLAFGHFESTEDLDIYPTDVYKDRNEKIWLANESGGVLVYNGYALESAFEDPDINDRQISSISEDGKGNLWFGTMDFGGLIQWTGERLFIYSDEFGLADNNINCLAQDEAGNLLIGTPSGLSVYDGMDFQIIFLSDDQTSNHVTALTSRSHGPSYAGAMDGSLYAINGMQPELLLREHEITSPITDLLSHNGELFITTDGQGLFVYKNGQLENISERSGISEESLMSVGIIKNKLYVGGKTGLWQVSWAESAPTAKLFAPKDGFVSRSCKPSCMLVDENALWIGTTKGLTIVNTEEIRSNGHQPRILVEELQLFYRSIDWVQRGFSLQQDGLPENLTLTYKDNYLRFQFKGVNHTDPDGVTYQWMLEGFENDWNPPSKQEQANYPNLPAGDFVFKLTACNGDGVCSETPYTYSFSIRPPFWKTTWFYIALILVVIAGTVAFVKRRERVLLAEKQILEETVEERTKQLREQKEIVEKQNKHITEGIAYAKNIQMAVLPSESELEQAFKDHFVFYRPKETVGGDFYWVYNQGDVVWAAAIDCTGHGVAGAFMSMIGSDLLNQIIIENKVSDPAAVLQEMDRGIKLAFAQSAKEFESDQGMDLAIIKINRKKKSLEFSGALRPLYIVQDTEIREVQGDPFPISCGHTAEKVFTTQTVSIKENMKVYLFSDGFADQFGGPKGKKFMIGKLQKLINSTASLSMQEQHTALQKSFDEWKGTEFPQIDDVLIMGIEL